MNRSRLALASRLIDERVGSSTPISLGGSFWASELAYIASQMPIVRSCRGAATDVLGQKKCIKNEETKASKKKTSKNMMKGMKEAAEES